MTVLESHMELVALGDDPDAAAAVATATGGISLILEGNDHPALPFRTVVRTVTDDPDALDPAATRGLLAVCARTICRRDRPGVPGQPAPGVTAVFGLVRRPDLTHRQADDHWRDVHAPLALAHHGAMWDYTQLSVVGTLTTADDLPPLDGIALCGFRNLDDVRNRFFNDDNSRDAIMADIASFADTSRSPRRLLATEWDRSR